MTSSDPKIAHVTTIDGSLRHLLLNQLRRFQEAGFSVYGLSALGPYVKDLEQAGIRHLAIPAFTRRMSLRDDLRALCQLARTMRRERFTIIHTHTVKGGLLGQYAALCARVPIRVHTIHGLYFPGHMKLNHRWAYVMMERVTMRFSHYNFSQNPEDVQVAVQERICPIDRIECIGNGIDLTVFDPRRYSAERRREIRGSLGLDDDHIVVGMVGRFLVEKGYLEMFEAVQHIKRVAPSARFLFIGGLEPQKSDRLEPSLIRQMHIDEVGRFLGFREDIVDLYAAMDVFVLPSHREGFPRVTMEASGMGLPCVATDIRGCRQTVEDGVTGHLVPVRDARRLAQALLDLIQDPSQRRRFGEAARQKAVREFDERAVFDRIEKTYRTLLADRRSAHA